MPSQPSKQACSNTSGPSCSNCSFSTNPQRGLRMSRASSRSPNQLTSYPAYGTQDSPRMELKRRTWDTVPRRIPTLCRSGVSTTMIFKRRAGIFGIALLVIGAVVAVYHMPASGQKGGKRGAGPGGAEKRVPVLVATAKSADVPVYLDGVGTVRALNTVNVRAKVDGELINISFREGQDVQKGYVLAKIDPVNYQAAYDQAVAKK